MDYTRAKGLAHIAVENYVTEPTQVMAAAAVKYYLQSFPEPVAKKLLGQIVKPKIIALPLDEEGRVSHGGASTQRLGASTQRTNGVPGASKIKVTPLQTYIDKEQLAALIDLSVGETEELMGEGWARAAVGRKVLDGISTVKGEEIVKELEPGFERFLTDCYKAL